MSFFIRLTLLRYSRVNDPTHVHVITLPTFGARSSLHRPRGPPAITAMRRDVKVLHLIGVSGPLASPDSTCFHSRLFRPRWSVGPSSTRAHGAQRLQEGFGILRGDVFRYAKALHHAASSSCALAPSWSISRSIVADALHVHIAPVCASMRMQSLLAIIWLELHLLAQPVNVLSHLCGILVSIVWVPIAMCRGFCYGLCKRVCQYCSRRVLRSAEYGCTSRTPMI